jgi:hypothetical protein
LPQALLSPAKKASSSCLGICRIPLMNSDPF